MSRSSLKVNAYKVTLEFPNGRTKSLEVQKETSVLDAVDAAGVDLPYLCRTGTCGTCASKVVSGQVDLVGNHVLSPEQVAKGYVLLCSTYPKTDVVLRTHQEEQMHLSPYEDQ